MADDRATELIRRAGEMKSERSQWERLWQETAQLVRPLRAEFLSDRPNDRKRTEALYDGTAIVAAENMASGLWGMAVNGASDWFTLRHPDPAMMQDRDVALWYDEATRRLQAVFAGKGGRFYAKSHELLMDMVSFGTGIFYCEERGPQYVGDGSLISFQCLHLTEILLAENADGEVDTVARQFKLTARQAVQKFGAAGVSDKTKRLAGERPDQHVPFLHFVMPRDDYDPGAALSAKGKRYVSIYIELDDKHVCREAGFHEMPYQTPRWSQASRSVYGDSPAAAALPDTKMVNAMSKTSIIAAQKAADPPVLAPDEGVIRGIRTTPGNPIYGAIDSQGRELVRPFLTGANYQLTLQFEEARRNAVREAYKWSLMMLVGGNNRTATEVQYQNEEKLRQLGPSLARILTEWGDPLIHRVFAIIARAGGLPPMPAALARSRLVAVEYISPLARAQKAFIAGATIRALESMAPIFSMQPEAADNIDGDAAVRTIADGMGAPAIILRDPRAVAALRTARQKNQQLQQAATAAPGLAAALKAGAEARQISLQGQAA